MAARYRFEFTEYDGKGISGAFFADGETELEARKAYIAARVKPGDEGHLKCVGMVPVPETPTPGTWTWGGWTAVPCIASPNTLETQI
jgi:hypothetical protein